MRDGDALDNNPHVSKSALEAIHSQVFGWALSRCNYERATAEDLMQQAYVELLSGNARFDNKSSLKTFVFSIVQNLAKSRYRRLANRFRLLQQFAPLPQAGIVNENPGAADSKDLWRVVKALPARQRDIIELVFLGDMTIAEAAAVMGVSVGTGRVHYDRAKKALRARLADAAELEQ
ncbi:MAG: RNA polymerase sigma factor [Gammaproteobacteria bacterium]|nr:RNA polymerase sigma factor [Gammaproteobacteria bacterium]